MEAMGKEAGREKDSELVSANEKKKNGKIKVRGMSGCRYGKCKSTNGWFNVIQSTSPSYKCILFLCESTFAKLFLLTEVLFHPLRHLPTSLM